MNALSHSTRPLIVGALLIAAGCGGNGSSNHHGNTPAETFAFNDQPVGSYHRVDRMGMPAVNTAVITHKDEYNAADPATDASGHFVAEIQGNVMALHTALDDDLTAAHLTPASTPKSMAQAGPLIVPDTLKIDTTKPAGFPNGRRLTDQAIDLTLAVVLLDLDVQPVTTLAALPLDPPANDVAFSDAFPYLASPH